MTLAARCSDYELWPARGEAAFPLIFRVLITINEA